MKVQTTVKSGVVIGCGCSAHKPTPRKQSLPNS